jgi:hypothetical protein
VTAGQVVAFLDAEKTVDSGDYGGVFEQQQQRQQHPFWGQQRTAVGYSSYDSRPESHKPAARQTRLAIYLTKLDVGDVLKWLKFFSFCSLEKQVQQCLTQLRQRRTEVLQRPLKMSYLEGLQSTHADQLLASLAPASK